MKIQSFYAPLYTQKADLSEDSRAKLGLNKLSFSDNLETDLAVFSKAVKELSAVSFCAKKALDYSNFPKVSIADVPDNEVKGKNVFIRVDYNVAFKTDKKTGERVVDDPYRIFFSLPTIINLLKENRKAHTISLASHVGKAQDILDGKKKFKGLTAEKKIEELKKLQSYRIADKLSEILKDVAVNPAKYGVDLTGVSAETIEQMKAGTIVKSVRDDAPIKSLEAGGNGKVVAMSPEKLAEVKAAVASGGIVVLENTRFYTGEQGKNVEGKKDPAATAALSGQYAELADLYINDAFGTAHRKHASTHGVTVAMNPEGAATHKRIVAGLLMRDEMTMMSQLFDKPQHPFVLVSGGAKVGDKSSALIAVMGKLGKEDSVIIGGKMAYAFDDAKKFLDGYESGELYNPFLEKQQKEKIDNTIKFITGQKEYGKKTQEKQIDPAVAWLGKEIEAKMGLDAETAKEAANAVCVIRKSQETGVNLVLPVDLTCSQMTVDQVKKADKVEDKKVYKSSEVPAGWNGYDIGPESTKQAVDLIGKAQAIFWNGPVGVFESKEFGAGSKGIAKAIAERTKANPEVKSVIGGGETVTAIHKFEAQDDFKQAGITDETYTHVSTGGGAVLDYIKGEKFDAFKALDDK